MLAVKVLRNKKGMATMEMIPVIIVVGLLINFSLGFFGVVHTGVLNSMAARNYTMETFRNRTNLVYFRDVGDDLDNYSKIHSRAHGIASEKRPDSDTTAWASLRDIGYGQTPNQTGDQQLHNAPSNSGIFSIQEHVRYTQDGVTPVWIRPMYGICLDAICNPSGS